MNVHVLQHDPVEGLGRVASWLKGRRVDVSYTRFIEAPALPSLGGLDLIIALGGPMSVIDESALPCLFPVNPQLSFRFPEPELISSGE